MKLINFNQLVEIPWKNGLGVTRQITIYPEDASLNDFIFRVSAASVTQTGSFSEYPEINRSLAVLEGNALELKLKDKLITFTPKQTVIHFHGMDSAHVTNCPNPVLDFGVMSREGCATHSLDKVDWGYNTSYTRKAAYTLLFSLTDDSVYLSTDKDKLLLAQYDSLLLTPEDSQVWLLTSDNHSNVVTPSFFIAEFTLFI